MALIIVSLSMIAANKLDDNVKKSYNCHVTRHKVKIMV